MIRDMNFWERLKNRIRYCDMSQESVASKLKIPIGTFRNWMLRQTYPDARESVEIARLLDTTVEHLVSGTDRSGLSEEERRLVDGFRRLSKCDREHITVIVDAWNRKFMGG
jgi:transcriptional regulator with XRE-family HTH domain